MRTRNLNVPINLRKCIDKCFAGSRTSLPTLSAKIPDKTYYFPPVLLQLFALDKDSSYRYCCSLKTIKILMMGTYFDLRNNELLDDTLNSARLKAILGISFYIQKQLFNSLGKYLIY